MTDFTDLSALYINTSLKREAGESHTALLMRGSASIMEKQGVSVEHLHLMDHTLAFGVSYDMTEEGAPRDDWPALWEKVRAADILVIGSPIWLGEESSLCRVLIERLYAMSGELNDKGQSTYYGKTGGAVVTGNEDGVKHVSMTIAYALAHLGFTIPPQPDTGWIGEAGPGPSYGDPVDGTRAGMGHEFTQQTATVMTWNLMHLARMLRDAGGYPRTGNDREAWARGERFGWEDPL
ncbi:MAG: flavodoxin family protein [Rhodosalinus sp.]|uniref:flavodoxin family protein n=1 Tax=Rhodosalinus sp. TaxID=2047741 RepID=UPI00397A0070